MELPLFITVMWLISGHLILIADDCIGLKLRLDTAMLGHYTSREYLYDGCNRRRKEWSLILEFGIVALLGPIMLPLLLGLYLLIGLVALLCRNRQSTQATL